MNRVIVPVVITLTFLYSSLALAAQQTVTLNVEGMFCPSCPYIVQKSIEGVSGVQRVVVSQEQEAAVVTFDDAKTNVEALTDATFDVGYPSELVK